MKLSFHGAAQSVTGSKHLLTTDNGQQILLDCGMFQGMGNRTYALNASFGFEPAKLSWVLLSHAHIDHCGLIPKLVKEGFTGKILCTQATLELTEILLLDSAQIQEQAFDESPNDPLYKVEDVRNAMEFFRVVEYNDTIMLSDSISALFTPTGHLVGSAAIHLCVQQDGKETRISYSADVGRSRHPLLRAACEFPQAEYIILESTYGDRFHDVQNSNIDMLLKWIKHTCLEKKGQLVIPAFSVGRTQELLFLLNQLELEKRLPELNYYVDSPLSMQATTAIKKHTSDFNQRLQDILKIDDDPFVFRGLKYVELTDDSRRLAEYKEPCVIISASGTADAGRVRHHIREVLGDKKNSIVFSGYCGEETLGGQLLSGVRQVELFGKSMDVLAEVGQLNGMSAHGDCDDLCNFLSCQDPAYVRAVFLVHGEKKAQESLAGRLSRKGFFPVHIPSHHEEYLLNRAKVSKPEHALKEAG
jgi:metallo-beta-lactamase family protein